MGCAWAPHHLHGANQTLKTCIVTGATSGIGKYAALGLARQGYKVIIPARNQQRATEAAAWIKSRVPTADIYSPIADLSLLAETRRLGATIIQNHKAIDLLINNAGAFYPRRETTPEGHERVLAVNHLSPFVLTSILLPALYAAGQARIVNTGSSSSDRASIDPDDLEGLRKWGLLHTYAQSKLALLITTRLLADRLKNTGITANTVHPGAVATSLIRAHGPIGLAWRLMSPFMLTEEAGAASSLHTALSPEFANITGAYVKKCRVVPPNPLALDPVLSARIWQATETLSGETPIFPSPKTPPA